MPEELTQEDQTTETKQTKKTTESSEESNNKKENLPDIKKLAQQMQSLLNKNQGDYIYDKAPTLPGEPSAKNIGLHLKDISDKKGNIYESSSSGKDLAH